MEIKDLTVLYYTSNAENEDFEAKIRDQILQSMGSLPLISVSQKPINMGKNICVGVHDRCYGNEFRQIQIGLKEVKTKYVIVAESDCLYPPSYFQFQPTIGACYRYDNVWVQYMLDGYDPNRTYKSFFKEYSDGAQIVRVKDWQKWIDEHIGTKEIWYSKEDNLPPLKVFKTSKDFTWTGDPVITFKTPSGTGRFTQIKKGVHSQTELPHWGNINYLMQKLCQPKKI